MKFNYRDFFIHNDDLHIIKEQLSIVDEKVSRQHALSTNAKAVWDMWTSEKNKQTIADELDINLPIVKKIIQTIADTLKINVEIVKKIIQICLMNTVENKNPNTIAKEFDISDMTVINVLKNAIGSDFKRQKDKYFISDAVKIYNHHKNEKTPEEIVVLVNNEKREYSEKITVEDVKLVLKIVDIAKNQMLNKGVLNIAKIAQEILDEFGKKISSSTIINLITALNLGETRYKHRFTEEQDAFILYNYLQRTPIIKIAELFNEKFKDSEGNALNIRFTSILLRLRNVILKPKGESETHYVLDLLDKYKTEYFLAVDIQNAYTKELLTHYTPPERIKARDRLARNGGNVDSTRQISGQRGNLEPATHQTFTTGETPASGQLGKKYGEPINPQGATRSL